MKNYLTVDVEDYFQVSAFEDIVTKESWPDHESRVCKNTAELLDLFDEFDVKATFFIVGWVAEQFPQLVSDIHSRGHEIGAHSYWHQKVYDLTPEQFRADTTRVKTILEAITGKPVCGFRAPSYSITARSLWALDILKELGFTYDSSIFPIYHDTYGMPGTPRFAYHHQNGLKEYPISTAVILGKPIPVSGGGYFRIFPYWFTRYALRTVNTREGQPFNFYLHPWEIDPEQPRFSKARLLSRFRHYNQLRQTKKRLRRLLRDFEFTPLPGG